MFSLAIFNGNNSIGIFMLQHETLYVKCIIYIEECTADLHEHHLLMKTFKILTN